MKFEPTAKSIALREYQKMYEISYRYYLDGCQARESEYNARCRGAKQIIVALGATDEDVNRIERLTRQIVNYDLEKNMQNERIEKLEDGLADAIAKGDLKRQSFYRSALNCAVK